MKRCAKPPVGWLVNFAQAIAFICISLAADEKPLPYDPLAIDAGVEIATADFTVEDTARKRDIPIRVYLPPGEPRAAPAVLYSHGLGGSRKICAYLGKHWAARGYVTVFLQHPGSDESVYRDLPSEKLITALSQAASQENFLLRVKDVSSVLDKLASWNTDKHHPLAGRLDMSHIGMCGHSFGAVTAQAVSGQSFGNKPIYTDNRIAAVILFSPSSPRQGKPGPAFATVKIPWLLMTGTKDVTPLSVDMESRLAVYPNLPGEKYELVLDGAEHYAFTDVDFPAKNRNRNPNHHRAILAISTAFWDTYLRKNREAKNWLQGDGPHSVLEPKDKWQWKAGGGKNIAMPGKTENRTLMAGGRQRTYRLYQPRVLPKAGSIPLVMVLHGGGQCAELFQELIGMDKLADAEGFLVAYPNGTGFLGKVLVWNSGGISTRLHSEDVDDAAFLADLIDYLIAHDGVDPSRVFVAGASNGAMMTYRLARDIPERIAAVAGVCGVLGIDPATVVAPMPVIHFHGTADEHSPYEGGRGKSRAKNSFRSVSETIAAWVRANGITTPPTIMPLPDKYDDGTTVTKTVYAKDDDPERVVLYTIHGGGHTWPGCHTFPENLGRVTDEIDANKIMWEFFKNHPKRL